MFEITLKFFGEVFNSISSIDLIYILITILSLIKCYSKGFVLSILSMSKWLLAYILTLILFPRVKPYVKNIIDNEYVLDVGLGMYDSKNKYIGLDQRAEDAYVLGVDVKEVIKEQIAEKNRPIKVGKTTVTTVTT